MVDEQKKSTEEGAVKTQEESGDKKKHSGRGADGIEEGGATKERSKTELDVEGLDLEESPQDVAADEREEKVQVKGGHKREWVLTFFSLLVILIMVIGGVFIWARYFASDDGKRLALNTPLGVVYELKSFFVPLNSNAESGKFLRATVVLELFNESSYEQIESRIEEVRSNIFKILVNASPKNVGNTKGKKVLAEKIVSTSNLLFGEKVVKRIFFKDVLVI